MNDERSVSCNFPSPLNNLQLKYKNICYQLKFFHCFANFKIPNLLNNKTKTVQKQILIILLSFHWVWENKNVLISFFHCQQTGPSSHLQLILIKFNQKHQRNIEVNSKEKKTKFYGKAPLKKLFYHCCLMFEQKFS